MNEKHYTHQDLVEKSLYEVVHELLELGAPIKFNFLDVYLDDFDIEILGHFETHPDNMGGVTYIWVTNNLFNKQE